MGEIGPARKVLASVPLLAALLSGCGSEPAPEPDRPAQRPSEAACQQARSALERQGRDGELLFEETGEAMVERQAWLRMPQSRRDLLIERLAVLAGCNAATPQREVEVSIRSETGTVLETRHLRPSTDFRAPRD